MNDTNLPPLPRAFISGDEVNPCDFFTEEQMRDYALAYSSTIRGQEGDADLTAAYMAGIERGKALATPPQTQAEPAKLREAAQAALNALQSLTGDEICLIAHHAKKDQHSIDAPCPVAARFNAANVSLCAALSAPTAAQAGEAEALARDARALLLRCRNMLSHPAHWGADDRVIADRRALYIDVVEHIKEPRDA